ncbi:Pyoverdine/dityrosine biosynthesis protein-domain-containing protein [Nemania sp. NC0429]|nr:Pyoverdine/dityrosine biosynthesis protein-domain-containing protein [Nemania sp. NC0429]
MDLLCAVDKPSRALTYEQPHQAYLHPGVSTTGCLVDVECNTSEEGRNEVVDKEHSICEAPVTEAYEATAANILTIIASYGVHSERGAGLWPSFDEFLPMVISQVVAAAPIRMLLPAFPFKENSSELVLGSLPDLGEELALAHLQGLCENISVIYENGAEILICSDGLVYNDLMGVSDDDAWEYGEAVRAMAASKNFRNIKFVRLWDLLQNPGCGSDQANLKKSKSYYHEHAASIRQELFHRFGDAQFKAGDAVKSSEDWAKTHVTYVNVLARKSIEGTESIAREMIERGKAYGSALRTNFPDYIRLSIHDSTGHGKLSLALIPNPEEKGSIGLMPWRSVIAVDPDGSYRAVYPDQVRDTHQAIYKYGRPYFFRAKSDLFNWDNDLQIDIEHLYPCGIIIRPVKDSPSTGMIPMQKVRELSNQFSPIIIRGFSDTLDTGSLTKEGHEPLPVRLQGIWKFEDIEKLATREVKKVLSPPGHQNTTHSISDPRGEGCAVFRNSRLVVRYLSSTRIFERLQDKTKFHAYKVPMMNEEQSRQLNEMFTYDSRTCLRFSWENGDLLVNNEENLSILRI